MMIQTQTRTGRARLLGLAALAVLAMGAQNLMALPITITKANSNTGVENVNLVKSASSTTVYGTFKSSGEDYTVEFTSSSGSGKLAIPSNGQSKIEGGTGNSPFTSLTFGLADDATFTKAVFNPDVSGKKDGHISFVVDYLGASGSPYTEKTTIAWNGQNYFTIVADGVEITSITFASSDIKFADAKQFRIGGAEPKQLPDGSMTVMLLGAGLAGIASIRRKNG